MSCHEVFNIEILKSLFWDLADATIKKHLILAQSNIFTLMSSQAYRLMPHSEYT